MVEICHTAVQFLITLNLSFISSHTFQANGRYYSLIRWLAFDEELWGWGEEITGLMEER